MPILVVVERMGGEGGETKYTRTARWVLQREVQEAGGRIEMVAWSRWDQEVACATRTAGNESGLDWG